MRNVADVETSTDGDNRGDNIATRRRRRARAGRPRGDQDPRRADFGVGSDGTWTLEVTNTGPTPDPGPVTVTDTLPPGVTYVSATGDGVACDATGQTVTCTIADGVDDRHPGGDHAGGRRAAGRATRR